MYNIAEVEKVFSQHSGVMRNKDLQNHRIYYRDVAKLIEDGYIEKIKYGYYQWQDEKAFSEASAIRNLFPDGILCMETALDYYGYTDRTPLEWHIAVDYQSSRTRFKIDQPQVHPHFVRSNRLRIGETQGEIDGIPVRIYDRERTICDCLYHKNKMDAEVFNAAIQNYIKDSKKNIPNLMKYAKELRVESKVRGVIGIWL